MGTDMVATYQKMTPIDNQSPDYIPVRMLEVELGQPLPTITALDEKKEQYYQRARCLVRLHTQPLGLVELQFAGDELSPDEYALHIWQILQTQINNHLRQDGLQEVTVLTANGLPSSSTPLCIEEREQ